MVGVSWAALRALLCLCMVAPAGAAAAPASRPAPQLAARAPDAASGRAASGAAAPVVAAGHDTGGRLLTHDNGYGGTYTYALDPQGNVRQETQTKTAAWYPADQVGTASASFSYGGSGNQLQRLTVTKPDSTVTTEKYFHDLHGNLDCITTDAWTGSACPEAPTYGGPNNPLLRVDYAWDDLDRIDRFRIDTTYNGAPVQTDDARYAYDALSRLVREQESHIPKEQGGVQETAAPQRTSRFTFTGLSRLHATERHENAAASQIITKTYRHDPFGVRYGMETALGPAAAPDDVAGTFVYGFDLHGSVSLLVQDTGATKASYGYEPYSKEDAGLTRGDRTADQQNPFNPFRYTGDRLDSGSGGMELGNGTRRYSPDFKRFWQRDSFTGAAADLRLSVGSWTANRYGLAWGNPANFVEVGGHFAPVGSTFVELVKLLAPSIGPTVARVGAGVGTVLAVVSAVVQLEQGAEPTTTTIEGVTAQAAPTAGPIGTPGPSTGTGTQPTPSSDPTLAPVPLPVPIPSPEPPYQYVVRGGLNTVDRWVNGAARIDENGVLFGISVQTWPNTPVEVLSSFLPHGTIGVTTLHSVIAAGGTITPDPLPGNPYHTLLSGLTAEQGVALFSDARPNMTRLRR